MTGQWFSPGNPVSSTNKTDRHDITEILLEVTLNTIKQTRQTHKQVIALPTQLSVCSTNINTIEINKITIKNKYIAQSDVSGQTISV